MRGPTPGREQARFIAVRDCRGPYALSSSGILLPSSSIVRKSLSSCPWNASRPCASVSKCVAPSGNRFPTVPQEGVQAIVLPALTFVRVDLENVIA